MRCKPQEQLPCHFSLDTCPSDACLVRRLQAVLFALPRLCPPNPDHLSTCSARIRLPISLPQTTSTPSKTTKCPPQPPSDTMTTPPHSHRRPSMPEHTPFRVSTPPNPSTATYQRDVPHSHSRPSIPEHTPSCVSLRAIMSLPFRCPPATLACIPPSGIRSSRSSAVVETV